MICISLLGCPTLFYMRNGEAAGCVEYGCSFVHMGHYLITVFLVENETLSEATKNSSKELFCIDGRNAD